jgi:hypothetical protein
MNRSRQLSMKINKRHRSPCSEFDEKECSIQKNCKYDIEKQQCFFENMDISILKEIISTNNLEMLKYILENNVPITIDDFLIVLYYGNFQMNKLVIDYIGTFTDNDNIKISKQLDFMFSNDNNMTNIVGYNYNRLDEFTAIIWYMLSHGFVYTTIYDENNAIIVKITGIILSLQYDWRNFGKSAIDKYAIHYCETGNLHMLQDIRKNNTYIRWNNVKTQYSSDTLLGIAIRNNDCDIVKWLLRDIGIINPNDPSNDIKKENGYTPIEYVIATDNLKMLKCLLENSTRYANINTDIYFALLLGNFQICKLLIDYIGVIIDKDSNGISELLDSIFFEGSAENNMNYNIYEILNSDIRYNEFVDIIFYLLDNGFIYNGNNNSHILSIIQEYINENKEINYLSCSNSQDYLSLNKIENNQDIIYFIMPNDKIYCFDYDNLIQWLDQDGVHMAQWIPNDINISMDESGRGGHPNLDLIVHRIPAEYTFYIDNNIYSKILKNEEKIFELYIKYPNLRIGNLEEIFGVSMLHREIVYGQL